MSCLTLSPSHCRILGSIVILGKACDLIDQHQQSMSASSPAKQRSQQEKEAAREAAEAEDEASSEEEDEESGIEESGKADSREAKFRVGSKVEEIVPAARVPSDLSRDVVQLCQEMVLQKLKVFKLLDLIRLPELSYALCIMQHCVPGMHIF